MAERTVWTNTLVDWEKIDAIELNLEWNIDAMSIWSWNVSDEEYEQLVTLKNDLNNAASWIAPDTEETREVTDIEDAIWSVVTDDINKFVTVTYTDWTKKIYSETWIKEIDSDNNVLSDTSKTWTYTAWVIEYTDWSIVNELWLWEYKFLDWNVAYKNKSNVFTWYNRFQETTVFWWSAVTLLDDLEWTWVDRSLDWLKWNQWKLAMSSDTNITFDNLIHWWVYTLFLVISWWAQPKFFAKKFDWSTSPTVDIDTYWPDWTKPTFADWIYVVSWIAWDTAIHLSAFWPTQNVDDSPAFT